MVMASGAAGQVRPVGQPRSGMRGPGRQDRYTPHRSPCPHTACAGQEVRCSARSSSRARSRALGLHSRKRECRTSTPTHFPSHCCKQQCSPARTQAASSTWVSCLSLVLSGHHLPPTPAHPSESVPDQSLIRARALPSRSRKGRCPLTPQGDCPAGPCGPDPLTSVLAPPKGIAANVAAATSATAPPKRRTGKRRLKPATPPADKVVGDGGWRPPGRGRAVTTRTPQNACRSQGELSVPVHLPSVVERLRRTTVKPIAGGA
jgi:hypothetical protein